MKYLFLFTLCLITFESRSAQSAFLEQKLPQKVKDCSYDFSPYPLMRLLYSLRLTENLYSSYHTALLLEIEKKAEKIAKDCKEAAKEESGLLNAGMFLVSSFRNHDIEYGNLHSIAVVVEVMNRCSKNLRFCERQKLKNTLGKSFPNGGIMRIAIEGKIHSRDPNKRRPRTRKHHPRSKVLSLNAE